MYLKISDLVRADQPSQQFPYSRHSSYEELCDLVGAFKPLDVYPCTVDNESWSEEIGMQALFGHLCSGTTFAHDQEMKMLAARRAASENDGGGDNSQKTASNQSIVDFHASQGEDIDDMKSGRTSLRPAPHLDEAGGVYRPPKRQRTSPVDSLKLGTPDLAQQQIYNIRQSFENHLERGARVSDADRLGKTQDKPTESKHADLRLSNDRAGEFLLSEMVRSPSAGVAAKSTQSSPETQITISDTAFDSQSPLRANHEDESGKVQRRKEAYKAAKELRGTWEKNCSLVASFDGHCEEELEL